MVTTRTLLVLTTPHVGHYPDLEHPLQVSIPYHRIDRSVNPLLTLLLLNSTLSALISSPSPPSLTSTHSAPRCSGTSWVSCPGITAPNRDQNLYPLSSEDPTQPRSARIPKSYRGSPKNKRNALFTTMPRTEPGTSSPLARSYGKQRIQHLDPPKVGILNIQLW